MNPKARRRALIAAGFMRRYRGRMYPDVDAIAEVTCLSRSAIYYWIRGSGGRLVDTLIRDAITQGRKESAC